MRSFGLGWLAAIMLALTALWAAPSAQAGAVASMARAQSSPGVEKSAVIQVKRRRARRGPRVRRRFYRPHVRRYRRFRRRPRLRIYIGPSFYAGPYYGATYCRVIRRRCTYRYGWRTRRWYRCIRRRGC